jgi:hypothetical protein
MAGSLQIDAVFDDGGFLGRLDDLIIYANELLGGVMAKTSEAIIDTMRVYPPAATIRYTIDGAVKDISAYSKRSTGISYSTRKGTLRDSWHYEFSNHGFGKSESLIYNDAQNLSGTYYARYVHDELLQRPYHTRRGWPTIQAVVRSVAGAAVSAQSDPGINLKQELDRVGEELKRFIETGQGGTIGTGGIGSI